MKKKLVGIIDYDCGNLHSIKNAFNKIKVNNIIIKDSSTLKKATHLVLPGVGAYDKAMKTLHNLKLIPSIKKFHNDKKPILGICLGMQLLFDNSSENKLTKGLGLMRGKVIKINYSFPYKTPIVGWNQIKLNSKNKNNLFNGIKNNSYFYFIHSFMVVPKNFKNNLFITYELMKKKIIAATAKENIFGCQFHPEKSGKSGMKVLKNFISI